MLPDVWYRCVWLRVVNINTLSLLGNEIWNMMSLDLMNSLSESLLN